VTARLAVVAAIALAALAAPAAAAPRTVAVTPLSTLGSEVSSASAKKITAELETALASITGIKVIGTAAVSDAIKKAKQQRLAACDGDATCLKDVGTLVGAELVVFGELGGLGDAQIVYLKLIDAKLGREVRGTTLDVSSLGAGGARAAAYRLLDPGRFVGTLAVTVDIPGAQVFVNGKLIGKSPVKPLAFTVGTHALRVTHPEYRDFVRFVDVEFDKAAQVTVELHQFPVVQNNIEGIANNTRINEIEPRWYRKWWAVAAFGAVAFTGALLISDYAGCRGICPRPDYTRPVDE
jgi:TolB-like protein